MGQPFFPGGACAEGEGAGVSAAVADGVSSGAGVADEIAFLRFDLVLGVGLGDAVVEAFFDFGEAVGDGVDIDFFAERLRCLRVGVGVGSGSKTFLIFVPNDSSVAFAAPMPPNNIAKIKTHFMK